MIPEKVVIEGLNIASLDLGGLLRMVHEFITDGQAHLIMYANIHTMNLAHKDDMMKSALGKADLIYCDGSGVLLGSLILGRRIREKLTAADFVYDVCDMFQGEGHSLFILAGERGVTEKASEILQEKFPHLSILGTHHGYFDKEGIESDTIISYINKQRPDCLFVGFGSPVQELWAVQNRRKLNVPVIWCVGAAFDFVSGKVKRSPAWLRIMHMEWLFRFLMEPVRMFSRYVIGNPVFLLRILSLRLIGREAGQ